MSKITMKMSHEGAAGATRKKRTMTRISAGGTTLTRMRCSGSIIET
jgi:hypothetical protein